MKSFSIDRKRYSTIREIPAYQRFYRYARESSHPLRIFWIIMLKICCKFYHTELSHHCEIGPGLYIGHPYGITINPNAIIGSHVNIHKGVTIGQENRGKRKGTPTIGNRVWIGINATIIGKIHIGDDVLIAPNTLVNCDIPSHSVVFGNPCIIKHKDNATECYL